MTPPASPYAALCARHGLAPAPERSRLTVSKSRRRLALWQDDHLLAELPVIIGRQPLGHKEREGDQRTPEGAYYICLRNAESRFHRFLGLSYPSLPDAERGLAQGLLDQAAAERIRAAIAARACPDWYTPLGGEVGIHGGGIERDGTLGCVALRNEDIELLWDATLLGTPVQIEP
jgi:murein L,D-transpeptidase YafK